MRKLFTIISLIVIATTFIGCGKSASEEATERNLEKFRKATEGIKEDTQKAIDLGNKVLKDIKGNNP